MSLEQFGWNQHFKTAFERLGTPDTEPARIAAVDRERFTVWTASGECPCTPGGRLRHEGELWPAVGDWVVLENRTRIVAVLPRQTAFLRKQAGAVTRVQVIASNIDVLFIVCGLDGDFNSRRVERYLLPAWESGAKPVIVLNKADLSADAQAAAAIIEPVASGAPVVVTSALTEKGLEALQKYVSAGKTAAFVGSSGAGKSTIVNRLLGEDHQRVREVRASDSRGRHTTVRRELFLAPEGWLLMDTPGLRELQLWDSSESVDVAFDDIAALAAQCRFRDCRHAGEPGCAVATAGIDEARLANYAKLQRELAHLERRVDQQSALEEKRKIKRIHRDMRKMERP